MNDATDHPTPNAPRETLAGDRLCVQCMHPLVGRAIERDARTGLLFVRCGECGTASALFEYPSLGPWLRRMKAVAGSTLIAIALVVTLLVGGIAFGFTTGASQAGSEAAGGALVERFRQLGGAADDTTWGGSMWNSADMKWIGTEEGARALADVRWSLSPIMVVLGITTIGALVMAPFAALIVFCGIYPKPMLDRIEPSVDRILERVVDEVPNFVNPDAGDLVQEGH